MVGRHSLKEAAQRMIGTADAHDHDDDDEAGMALFRLRRAEARANVAEIIEILGSRS